MKFPKPDYLLIVCLLIVPVGLGWPLLMFETQEEHWAWRIRNHVAEIFTGLFLLFVLIVAVWEIRSTRRK